MDAGKKTAILVGGSDLFLGLRGISVGTRIIREKILAYYDEVIAVNFNYFLDRGRCLKRLVTKIKQENCGELRFYGYSQGGEVVLRLARALEGIAEINLLVTVDVANGPWSHRINRTVPSNVKRNINVYQQTPNIPLRSYGLPATGGDATEITNIDLTQKTIEGKLVSHTNIERLIIPEVCEWMKG